MHSFAILQSLVLLTLANGAPVVAKKVFGAHFSFPLDGNALFFDGQPLFGSSKTVRGIVASILVTTIAAPFIGLDFEIGALVASAAMAGDLASSFTKRRLRRPPSSRALGIDQLPESLLPLWICQDALALSVLDIAAAVGIFFASEIVFSRILYRVHLRDQPY